MEATKQNAQQPKPQAPVAKKANNGVSSNVGWHQECFYRDYHLLHYRRIVLPLRIG